MAPQSLNLKFDVWANCISHYNLQSTDQVLHGRNQLQLSVIALTSQIGWWSNEFHCVTLSYKRLLDHKLDIVHKLLMWPRWWHHLLPPFVKSYHRSKSQLQVSTSSSLHLILAGVGTKSFLPVTSCHVHELSILVKIHTAGRFFFSFC